MLLIARRNILDHSNFAQSFTAQNSQSHKFYQLATEVLPGGVNSTARTTFAGWTPYPLFAASGQGAYLTDVDGHRYTDYLLALGPLILGHRPPSVTAKVIEAIEQLGSIFGLPYELEQIAARQFLEMVPSAEAVRFTNSGSEAVGSAVRLARAVTGRPRLLRFEGHYHGWQDAVYWSNKPTPEQAGPASMPVPVPAGPGVPPALADTLIICPWNDFQAVEHAFSAYGDEIAAVLTEPVMCNAGCIPPEPGYLQFLREITRHHQALLIFDEVITGFRLAPGGAQGLYNVQPDLSTFAKALGAGFPVAALAGTWSVMRWISEGRYSHSGTYNANIVAMAAVNATLDILQNSNIYQHIYAMGERLMTGLQHRFDTAGIAARVQGIGPCFQVWFTPQPVSSWRTAAASARPDLFRIFREEMLMRGVLFHPDQFECFFISAAHQPTDIDATLAALDAAMPALKQRFAANRAHNTM